MIYWISYKLSRIIYLYFNGNKSLIEKGSLQDFQESSLLTDFYSLHYLILLTNLYKFKFF